MRDTLRVAARPLGALLRAALGLVFFASVAMAQTYPTRPIRVVVNFAAGGSADTLAQIIGQELSVRLGQSFVVENHTGAGGNIGADIVAKSPPDGYTLLLTPSSFALAPAFYANLSFDPSKDFAPVTLIGGIPSIVVVHPSLPVKTLAELIALAKSKPGQISYASADIGSGNHLLAELFKITAGIDLVHVPYRGNPLAEIDVIAGRVPVFIDLMLTGLPHVRSGELRALATTGVKRPSVMPDIPTVAEAGVPGLKSVAWFAIYAPAGTPKPIVDRLNGEISAVLAMPSMIEKLNALGVEVTPGGPASSTR